MPVDTDPDLSIGFLPYRCRPLKIAACFIFGITLAKLIGCASPLVSTLYGETRQGCTLSKLEIEKLRQAAESGEREAQYQLGDMYVNGVCVRKNESLGSDWYRKAAEQEYAPAQYDLAVSYLDHVGVKS